jgi:hypothetical protein
MPEININLSGGASYFQAPEASGAIDKVSVVGNFSFTSMLTRETSLNARYTRRYHQALGFGRNFLTDYASLRFAQNIKTRILVGVSGAYTLSRDPLEPDSEFSGERYQGYFSVQITRGFSAGATYSLWITDRSQTVEAQSFRRESNLWTFFLRYTKTWP